MKKYYLFLSRISLGVIILQAILFLTLGLSAERLNKYLDNSIMLVADKTRHSPELREALRPLVSQLSSLQEMNRSNKLLQKLIFGIGFIHVMVCYSIYIYFLRTGYSWPKWTLHLNNLSLCTIMIGLASVIWILGYIIGTRVLKHIFLVKATSENSLNYDN